MQSRSAIPCRPKGLPYAQDVGARVGSERVHGFSHLGSGSSLPDKMPVTNTVEGTLSITTYLLAL